VYCDCEYVLDDKTRGISDIFDNFLDTEETCGIRYIQNLYYRKFELNYHQSKKHYY